jgi:hypothetical protein
MRTVYWLFVVSVALFIGGIAFVIAGARTARLAQPAEPAAVAGTPVASVRQIMTGIVAPAATVVYDAVATTITAAGVEEVRPQNDAEWARVADSAAALAESGNLMLLPGRAVDQGDWATISKALTEAATVALKAAEAKDADGILNAGSAINDTCDNCHAKYQRQ